MNIYKKMSGILTATSLMLLSGTTLYAGEDGGHKPVGAERDSLARYIVEIQPGKKMLYVDELGLDGTTTLGEMLTMFPELLIKEGDEVLANYDLQVDGVSSGRSRETLLEHVRVDELLKVEVSQLPAASQQKNGQGGVIDLTFKDLREGVSGNVTLEAGTMADVMPAATVNWRKKDLEIRSSLMMEYYHPLNDVVQMSRTGKSNVYQSDTGSNDYVFELARVSLKWTPRKSDELKAWAWESYSYDGDVTKTSITSGLVMSSQRTDYVNKNVSYAAGAQYKHSWDRMFIESQLEFSSVPMDSYTENKFNIGSPQPFQIREYSELDSNGDLSGYVKYRGYIIPEQPHSLLSLEPGFNFTLSDRHLSYEDTVVPDNNLVSPGGDVPQFADIKADAKTIYLSPYLELNSRFGPCYLKAGARYQYHGLEIGESGNVFAKNRSDVTGFFHFGWQVVDHHHLSLILDRSIKRPSLEQLYPHEVYDPESQIYFVGNPDLVPCYYHSASVNYIFNFESDGHRLLLNPQIQYVYADNLIAETMDEKTVRHYQNNGHADVVAANIMLVYSWSIFSCSFASNIFNNWSVVGNETTSKLYYNLSFAPALNFENGWLLTSRFDYNSPTYSLIGKTGDYFYGRIRLSKTWGKWTVFTQFDDIFHKFVQDELYTEDYVETTFYNLHRLDFKLGFRYKF